jgi:hypothetical protein
MVKNVVHLSIATPGIYFFQKTFYTGRGVGHFEIVGQTVLTEQLVFFIFCLGNTIGYKENRFSSSYPLTPAASCRKFVMSRNGGAPNNGLAQTSPGANPDFYGRLRPGSARGRPYRGDPSRRCGVVSTR